MIEALVTDDRLPGLAQECRQYAVERYDWSNFAEKYVSIYEEHA